MTLSINYNATEQRVYIGYTMIQLYIHLNTIILYIILTHTHTHTHYDGPYLPASDTRDNEYEGEGNESKGNQ